MASLVPMAARTVGRLSTRPAPKLAIKPSLLLRRAYSAEAPPPPLLTKLKGDLKTAMKAKDTARLGVIRSVISSTLNASKTASPIKTDAQLVALLRKQARSAQEAAEEFRAAGREDLVEKEEAQVRILEEYAAGSGIESIGEAELQPIVEAVLAEMAAEGVTAKSQMGEAMKRLLAPGGPLDGKDVQKTEVIKVVKELSAKA
ncbi:uncharacterized protein E0L32_004821 [Thyridium curvatum]|uniref:Altered inheritance of mitochondria protein 41 n=1 Tax=Thyridium curvatum TaxID=1093900 RepID=A0A507BDJ4_9PEZI|nr:uncharacterized protein E0L32_004821 [Thyridium curvatum]TPX14991.1 hypothetical protein E0L32_004821 [Thyridium curvatum]